MEYKLSMADSKNLLFRLQYNVHLKSGWFPARKMLFPVYKDRTLFFWLFELRFSISKYKGEDKS